MNFLARYEAGEATSEAEATEILKAVKQRAKLFEEKRKEATQPLNEALKTINGWFRPEIQRLEKLEQQLKVKISLFLESAKQQNILALTEAGSAQNAEEAEKALARVVSTIPSAGISVRKVWKFKIVDEAAIPRELCSPDAAKIRQHMKDNTPPMAVEGLEFYQEDLVSARS